MGSFNCTILLLLAACCLATAKYSSKQINEILKAHNDHRRKEKSSNMETLYWDTQLAAMAQEWANRCDYSHGHPNMRSSWEKPGQNLYVSSRKNVPDTAAEGLWWEEIEYYHYRGLACDEGEQCGHYTQVVWAETNRVGCGEARCQKNGNIMPMTGLYVVCNYGPPGNWRGQHPYKKGATCTECGNDKQKFCVKGLCDKCRGSNCECKVNCKNGGSKTRDCKCKCADGFLGKQCEQACKDTHHYCDPAPGVMGWPRSMCGESYVQEGCPKMCKLC